MAANISLILLITQKGKGERETNKLTTVSKRKREGGTESKREREIEGQRARESEREQEKEGQREREGEKERERERKRERDKEDLQYCCPYYCPDF
jgi:hypothetical protein